MSEKPHHRVEIATGETDEWPEPVKRRFIWLCEIAHANDFSLLCSVGLNHKEKRLSVFFSPTSSQNPHLMEMCEDLSEMFGDMARRLKQ